MTNAPKFEPAVSLHVRFFASPFVNPLPRAFPSARWCVAAWLLALAAVSSSQTSQQTTTPQRRAKQFLTARAVAQRSSSAAAWQKARAQQATFEAQPRTANLTAPWTPLGPISIVSPVYGNLSGRVTALALDPNDTTGNTLYLGTTGGGVWSSTNAASASPTFIPLTDNLPVFSQSAGSNTLPSLSIGALAVQPTSHPVLLAGTGDPNDATDSLYGEGLLRSADNGATWTLIQYSHDGTAGFHAFAGLSTAAIAWSTATPTLAVAAMSTSPQAALVEATQSTSTPGLYYSTDAGVTWQMASLYDGASLVQKPQPVGTSQTGNAATAVVWDALRGSFYAAVRGHGYYQSSDGITWYRLAAQPGTALTTANCPVGANGMGSATCPIFRGALAVQPVTGDLYALTINSNDLDQGLWQDRCNATGAACTTATPTFDTRLDNGTLETGNGSTAIAQGDYNLVLTATPAAVNSTLLLAGTVDLYRCSLPAGASACTLRNTTNALNGCTTPAGVAPSQHALATFATASGTPYTFIGNDGGLWRSLDGVAETGSVCSATDHTHFDDLNTNLGSLAEIVGFAQSPTDTDTLLAGLGALGSAATSAASALTAWPQLSAGEGGFPQIDPAASTNWYAAIGTGVNLKQCSLGSLCGAANFTAPATIGPAQVAFDATLLDAPTLLDPAQPANLITATCRVWRGPAADGTTWSTANAISTGIGGSTTPCSATSPLIRSLAAAGPAKTSTNAQNSGSTVLYAGLSGALDGGTTALGGHLFTTSAADTATSKTTWSDLANNSVTNDTANAKVFNPYAFDVSSVTVDTHDATGATVYATIMGFGLNAATPHVYRSIDFGAHWLNVSANLPQAPVNALIVDPNDANTLYVASDAGVYVTQAITTCATTSCWNLLGTGLPNAPVTMLAAGASLATSDGRKGMLRAGTYGRGIWQTPLLTAVSSARPALTLSATSLTFASQQVGTQSSAQTLTVTSTGSAPLAITTLVLTGDFTETDTCAHQTLAVNATCSISLVFAPAATGARSGQLTVFANIASGQATVALNGTATAAAAIVFTPSSLTFPATLVNQTAATQIITVANTGGNAATLQVPVVTDDFSISANTCGSTLAASTACSLSIAFTPTAAGSRTGTLSLTDSAGTQTAALSGIGNAPATDTLTPLALTFPQQILNTLSATQAVTLTNSGSVPLTLITASTNSTEFTVVNNCGASLSGPATCSFSIAFTPNVVGTRTATLTIGDQFRTQTIALSGLAVAPAGVSLSPASLDFGSIGLGLTGPTQTLTLTNNGGLTLAITSMVATGDFVLAATTCGTTLAVNSACAATLVFAPTGSGTRTGTLSITDNAPASPQSARLTGIGIDFTLTATGSTNASISAMNGSATFPLLLNSTTSGSTVALACTGMPAHTTCKVTPASTTLGGAIVVSAVVATGVAGADLHDSRDSVPWLKAVTTLFAVMLPCLFLRRRNASRILALAVSLSALTGMTSCGAGRIIPTTTGAPAATPTPDGIYTFTVSATAAGITRSVPLSVTVQ